MNCPTVFVVSGGSGASADQLVQTVSAQFPDTQVKARIFSNICDTDQVDEVLSQAVTKDAVFVHTLVDCNIFNYLYN